MTLASVRTFIAAPFDDDERRDDRAKMRRRPEDGRQSSFSLPKAEPLLDPQEEAPLLCRLQGEDDIVARSAFKAIYEAYASTLWRFVVRLTNSPAEAEEIVHDVFLYVWTNRTHWNPAGGVAAYLFRAARNRATDARRHTAVVARIGDDVTLFALGMSVAPSAPDVGLLQTELRQAVQTALAALPERRRTALVLRHLHGMSYAQIATVLGTTEKAAFILVARTRDALRPVLQKFSDNRV